MPRTSSDQLADNLHDVIMETLPSLVKEKVTEQVKKEVLVQAQISSQVQSVIDNAIHSLVDASVHSHMSGHILHVHPAQVQSFSVPEQKHQLYLAMKADLLFSAVCIRDQDDPHDDAHPEGENSEKRAEEPSYKVEEDMTCFGGKQKEKSCLSAFRKITPLVQSCQRDPEAPALSLINQDSFNVNKCIKKFNPYARYGVENWKNPHAKIFYIRRQKEPGRPKEEIYSNSKIVQVIKTFWELGHEHKFITEIVARRANGCIVSITEPDYKNLNKNDIEDMYLLIMNNKVPDYANTGLLWSLSVFIRSSVIWERVHDFQLGIESYQQKINLTAPTITFPGIEEYDVFSIVYEPVHGIIYTNSKKEKRVMRPSEIHKFCDATLRRTLEGLKSYYNDVKYGFKSKK
ncbi:hypothetical protein Tco_0848015 [Tanacetum coccineum]